MATSGRVHVGTSGWVYQHWKGRFYPDDLPQARWFDHYAARFRSVEVNNTFYRLPSEKAVARWRDESPGDFTFAFKASRYLTHQKRLLDARGPARRFLDRLAPMGDKLGVVLFQTPPNLKLDLERLRGFLRALPQGEAPYAVEFRHASWHAPEVFDLLGEHGVGFCIHDFGRWGRPRPVEVTADMVYLRFHGARGPYRGEYGADRLRPWAKRIGEWTRQRRRVFAYFNNDGEAMAPLDAARLARQAERRAGGKLLAA